jgi:hypothetical protein
VPFTERLATMNRTYRIVVFAVVMAGSTVPALACGPAPPQHYAKTEQRVHERFDSVDSVVLLTLLDVRRVSKIDMGIELWGEKSTFRIDRVFKGRARPGDKLILTTYSTCANYVVEKWDGLGGPIVSSRQWLIYRNQSETEMPPHDMAQPIDLATFDLKVLSGLVRAQSRSHASTGKNV